MTQINQYCKGFSPEGSFEEWIGLMEAEKPPREFLEGSRRKGRGESNGTDGEMWEKLIS